MRARAIEAFVLTTAMLWAGGASAETDEVRTWSVEPGTTMVVVEDHRVPQVTFVLEFPVGSWSPWAEANDAEEAFEIQLDDPDGSLRKRADALAADVSLVMTAHAAFLWGQCLASDLETAMELVGDILRNEAFDTRELKRLAQERKLAWQGSGKEPNFRLFQALARLFYAADDPRRRAAEKPDPPETRNARLVGTRDAIVRLPGRVVAFAGDLTTERAGHLVEGLLPPVAAETPAGTEVRLPPMVSAGDRPAASTVRMPRITQTFFRWARPSLEYDDPGYPAFLVADHALGGHFFARLGTALRHEGGETYAAYTSGRGGVTREIYGLHTYTRSDNASETEAKLRDVLETFHASGITEEERLFAVGHLLGRQPFTRQSPAQILFRFLNERRHGLPEGFHDRLAERAAALPLEAVNAFIHDFYDPARYTLVRVEPK